MSSAGCRASDVDRSSGASIAGGMSPQYWSEPAVEPVHSFDRGVLDILDTAPRSAWFDQFGLVEAVDRLRERVDAPIAVK